MGVPAFYRWISEKYSKIVVDMLEKRPNVIEGVVIPLNLQEPNPNGIEYDNLYVDMNGLIHPCSHPEDREPPKTEAEMYINVTKYLDRLVAAVRPRRVLYLAIDGVAPRAKMNQQRSRRFRAAQDVKEKKDMMDEVIAEMVAMGYDAPEEKEGGNWDSNVITPGTEFMIKLSTYVRFYVLDRMNRDPFWKGITVVFSDASEPGEGEHKIMSYIRNQRAQPGFDPNQRHILHGLDADLIMLALATHEAHFTILREKVTFGRKKEEPEVSEGQKLLDAQSMRNGILVSCVNPQDEWVYKTPMQALHVNVLREYLDNEFSCLKHALPFGYDLERIIDDFIFICFFVGNDFLPHLPSLDIRDGALDFLMECYKELLPSLGDYITSPGGNLNLRQADVILGRVGEIEDQIFIQRKHAADNEERRRKERFGGRNSSGSNVATGGNRAGPHGAQPAPPSIFHHSQQTALGIQNNSNRQITYGVPGVAHAGDCAGDATTPSSDQNKAAASALKQSLLGKRGAAVAISATADSGGVPAGGTDSEEPVARIARTEVEPATTEEAQEAIVTDESAANTEDFDIDDDEYVPPEASVILPAVTIVAKQKAMTPAEIERAKEELKKRIKDKEQALIDRNKETIVDAVKLHEVGWKDRYYGEKYKKENIEKGGGLAKMAFTYVQGLCWVLKYYYQGVPSWNWYYPFHYAPFASDLRNIDSYGEITFELSEPFRPIEQLLAVFPANSVRALPEPCHWLMTDPSSPIYDLYDSDIPIDPNGKHLPWLWILLLPFVDERRITAAFELCRAQFSLADAKRNKFGLPMVFVHKDHHLGVYGCEHLRYTPGPETDAEVLRAIKAETAKMNETFGQIDLEGESNSGVEEVASSSVAGAEATIECPFDAITGRGMSGVLAPAPPSFYAPLHTVVKAPQDTTFAFQDIADNRVLCFTYTLLPMDGIHKSELLPGVVPQPSNLTQFDLMHRRPPRLNKGGFNITDIFQSLKDKEQRGNSSYRGASHYDSNPYGNYGHGRQGHQTFMPQQGGGRSHYGLQAQLQNNLPQDQFGRSPQQYSQYNSYQQPSSYSYQQQQQQPRPQYGYQQNQRGPPQQQYPPQYPAPAYQQQQYLSSQYPPYHQQDNRYAPNQAIQTPAYYPPATTHSFPQDQYAPPAAQRRPTAPIEHTVTDLRDRQTQRLNQYGSHRVDRSVPIGASGRQGGSSSGSGRQVVFLDTIPVQAQQQPAPRYRHNAPGGAAAGGRGGRGGAFVAPAQVPPAFRAPPGASPAGARGYSFNQRPAASVVPPAYQQQGLAAAVAPPGAAGGEGGGADSLQSIRDQLLQTLQQQQHPH